MDQSQPRRQDSAPKLHTEPKVTLKAATTIKDWDLFYQTIKAEYPSFTSKENGDPHEDGEYLIEFGGRACYQSFHNPAGRTTDEYIRNIINQKHYSVIEHASASFYIEQVSRAFTHELIRHRHLSYSQLSQRYVDGSNASYVSPPLVSSDPELFLQWSRIVDTQHEMWMAFQQLIDERHAHLPKKQRREAGRTIAPNAVETKILVSGNLRAWREFLEKRWTSHAEAEIREVAQRIFVELNSLYPSVFSDIVYK